MAGSTQSNNSFLWLLALAVCFLLGKTCNCRKEKVESTYYYTPVPNFADTVVAVSEPARVVKPVHRRSYTHRYIRGPRGGCYYINANGNKQYVDRSFCD
jgi:hypothetical protein